MVPSYTSPNTNGKGFLRVNLRASNDRCFHLLHGCPLARVPQGKPGEEGGYQTAVFFRWFFIPKRSMAAQWPALAARRRVAFLAAATHRLPIRR